jgi:XTP/dITP diphosphohydrolase
LKIVLATRNIGKLKELQQLLKINGIEYIPVSQFNVEDVEETEDTFEGNAVLKARFVSEVLNQPTIADDSGMEILALNNYPGVHSARCAGETATDEEKRQHILKKMGGIKNRQAKFISVVAFHNNKTGITSWFRGECTGEILYQPRGQADINIQYDSIFHLPKIGKTFAELPKEEKNKISHRAKSCKELKDYLRVLYEREYKCGIHLNGQKKSWKKSL